MDIGEAPAYFLCPISLQVMKDPVTVSSGITYDRDSIQKWLFSLKNTTCPVTKQPLSPTSTHDLIPNLTLRRLIHNWSTSTVGRPISPEPRLRLTQIAEIVADLESSPHALVTRLRRLWSIAMEGESSRECMEDSGVIQFLISILHNDNDNNNNNEEAVEEALIGLYHMNVNKSRVFESIVNNEVEGEKLVNALLQKTKLGKRYQTRVYATMLLKTAYEVTDLTRLPGLRPEIFTKLVEILRDRISYQATMSVLKTLVRICTTGGRNRTKAAEAGAVAAVVELLMDNFDGGGKRSCEILFTVLDQLCGCAEGRAELLGHPAGLAVVGTKMVRVSSLVSQRAVRVVEKICRFSGKPAIFREMADVGVLEKLFAVAEGGGGGGVGERRLREKAMEILKLHYRVWKGYSSCVPPDYLLSSNYFQ